MKALSDGATERWSGRNQRFANLILDFGRRYVVGMSPFNIEDLWFKLYQVEHNTGPIMYRRHGRDRDRDVGPGRERLSASPYITWSAARFAKARRGLRNGWYAFKGDLAKIAGSSAGSGRPRLHGDEVRSLRSGRQGTSHAKQLKQACRIVEAVRNAVGDEIDLVLEFHGRFSPIMALEAIRAMVPYRPRWCEEPIPAHNHEAMAQVVAASPLRVATGEHTYSRFGFLDLLSRKGAHLIQPDIIYCGGFLETKKIAAIAETFYVSVAPHNCRGPLGTVIAMHLCANIPNFDILETFEDYDVPWRCDLTPGTPRVEQGYYDIPTKPGWGVEVDEELIRAHPENPDAKLNMFAGEVGRDHVQIGVYGSRSLRGEHLLRFCNGGYTTRSTLPRARLIAFLGGEK